MLMNILKSYKPTTPGLRNRININKSDLTVYYKPTLLKTGKKNSDGRNNQGRITVWHRGGGNKNLYRFIDFKRNLWNISGKVLQIEYDPQRTSWIALIAYENGILSYILAPEKLNINDTICSGENVEIKIGNALPLYAIPVGTFIHNIEIIPGGGGKLIRSAGTFAQLIQKLKQDYVVIKLQSGALRYIPTRCMATIGKISNENYKNISFGKAGVKRWLNIRPHVRGVAMNPVDHPHGGGEGKTSGGRPSVTPWGRLTKNVKTRKNKVTSKFMIKN
jgi:large subunit ribosomal protein L2